MIETKIFDPADGFAPITDLAEITDPTVVKRGNQWWMFAAGQIHGDHAQHLFSASLPGGAPLSARGWQLTARSDDPSKIAALPRVRSRAWDGAGGRHCPSFVRAFDPHTGQGIERLYYANSAANPWGPYTIAFLEWDGEQWIDQPEPAFAATEAWEHGSVYEPNLIYADGQWRMWYVAGSNIDNYIVHGYAESADGRTGWTPHRVFAAPDEKMFDFCVAKNSTGYEAVFSRVWLGQEAPPPQTGLWWCRADAPHPTLSSWSEPVQILTAEDKGWRTGPWKPSVAFEESNPDSLFVFFDGIYRTSDPGPFPFAFTLGCVELDREELVRSCARSAVRLDG
ncbi:MAG TPA: hypothetical protein VHE33_00470 [Acidobacteriaceae bacterium]|nr:hypothetical protein [Acidobacteriaceae bacterium]